MTDFQLDTSGTVALPVTSTSHQNVGWSDLTPFAQGYVEAMLGEFYRSHAPLAFARDIALPWTILAPETLARIIADCEAAQALGEKIRPADGASFWRLRNIKDYWASFPPLTPTLRDGKVYLSEAGQ